MIDDCHNTIKPGDIVKCVALDASRGGHLYLTQGNLLVVAIGRTRVKVRTHGRGCDDTVGGELLRVVEAVDGRPLRRPSDNR